MGQRIDRVKSCLACHRLFDEVVTYKANMLCTTCWAEQRDLARGIAWLREQPAHTTECALGCLLHNLGLQTSAEAMDLPTEIVTSWVHALTVPAQYAPLVWREWGVRWAGIPAVDGPKGYRKAAR